jgi:hypothetical protein
VATPASGSLYVPRGTAAILAGRGDALAFTQTSTGSFPPNSGAAGSQLTVVYLHASSAGANPAPTTYGHIFNCDGTGDFSDPGRSTSFRISASQATDSVTGISFNPRDSDINSPKEYLHCGWSVSTGSTFNAISERRYRNAVQRLLNLYPQASRDRIVWTGGSMGGWGSLRLGIRSHGLCSLVASSRPRWRSTNTAGQVAMPTWTTYSTTYAIDSAPALSTADGGITARAHFDLVQYVTNTTNWIPPIQWCVGRNDGFTPFSEHVEAVAALRSKGVPFQFAWNNGDHSGGDVLSGMGRDCWGDYSISRGCPLFTNCSRDQDPSVDTVGQINLGLRFRNVVESAGSWSCEVTRIATSLDSSTTGCTVDVKPYSRVYTGSPAAQTVTIPAAGTWVSVSF